MASLLASFTDTGPHCRYSLFTSLKRALLNQIVPHTPFCTSSFLVFWLVLNSSFFVFLQFSPNLTSSPSVANWAKFINQIFFSPFPCQQLPVHQFVIFCSPQDPYFDAKLYISNLSHRWNIPNQKLCTQAHEILTF